jgi:TRAP-type mannitol/chloroaromatic compound transport system permease large subunit
MQVGNMAGRVMHALVAPIVLIVSVLGSILAGIATPTEAAGVGAIGATLLAGHRLAEGKPVPVYAAAASLVGVIVLTTFVDMRVTRVHITMAENVSSFVALLLCMGIVWGLLVALVRTYKDDTLLPVMRTTARLSSMIFIIVIGAQAFSLVFRGLGGDDMVHEFLTGLPGGAIGAMIVVMLVMFVMGFFLDFIEITFVVVPIVGPALLKLGFDPVWLGVMIAINLQTSFLTPPFGFALFYLRGVAPPEVTTMHIYRGVIPFILIQLLMLVILAYFPAMATWLPKALWG